MYNDVPIGSFLALHRDKNKLYRNIEWNLQLLSICLWVRMKISISMDISVLRI